MSDLNFTSNSRRIARWLIWIEASVWIALALIIALDLHPAIPAGPIYRWGMTGAAALVGLMLLGLHNYATRSSLAFSLLVALLVLIALVSLADQFGWADLAVFLVNLGAIVSLLWGRLQARYRPSSSAPGGGGES